MRHVEKTIGAFPMGGLHRFLFVTRSVESGERSAESGVWRVESGGWRAGGVMHYRLRNAMTNYHKAPLRGYWDFVCLPQAEAWGFGMITALRAERVNDSYIKKVLPSGAGK